LPFDIDSSKCIGASALEDRNSFARLEADITIVLPLEVLLATVLANEF
jgi:hypothetical protein